jgi:hypothetical protein
MKFFSIFCHTIRTHTCRQPHALAGPTVNFSSLEKEKTKKEENGGRMRESPHYDHIFKSPSQKLEDRHFCRGDTVQRSIDCTDRVKGGLEEGKKIPPPPRCIVVF